MHEKRDDMTREQFEARALEHLDSLYATAVRLTRSPDRAEDLVQDALVKAWRFRGRFEPGTNFKAWLLKIQTNTFINSYRRANRESAWMESVSGRASSDPGLSNAALRALTDPENATLWPMVSAEIQHAVDALPEDYRVMIVLADVEELTYKEIAEAIGRPIGTVMSRLYRARKLLQERLWSQAVELGIVKPDAERRPSDEDARNDAPVSLDAYRRKRSAS